MLALIKKIIPSPVKEWLRPVKTKLLDNPKKRKLFLDMQEKHKILLQQIKGKKKIKVVFLAIHKSIWKVDPVFRKMLADPFFEPVILVCPYTVYGEERMWQDMQEAYEYFEQKGYPLLSSYIENEQRWLTLEEIQPDLVFFTNPHNLTRKEYYEDAYLNYLSCYVPYYSDIASNYNLENAYNQTFHNVAWVQFVSDAYSLQRASKVLANKGVNLSVVGNLQIEQIINMTDSEDKHWKKQGAKKKKVIYAPHQSIFESDPIHLSTFIEVGEPLKNLAEKYKDEIQWSFKPHPLLKEKLYRHPGWGKEKTDAYYKFWADKTYTQLDTGDYASLFMTSDAIIHDCGSFILDYLVTRKPCAYLLLNSQRQLQSINSFGLKALKCYEKITSVDEIELFLKRVLGFESLISDDYTSFLKEHIEPLYIHASPSSEIIKRLKGYFYEYSLP